MFLRIRLNRGKTSSIGIGPELWIVTLPFTSGSMTIGVITSASVTWFMKSYRSALS